MKTILIGLIFLLNYQNVLANEQEQPWEQLQRGPTGASQAQVYYGQGPTGAFGYWQPVVPVYATGPTGYAPPSLWDRALNERREWCTLDSSQLIVHFSRHGKFNDEFLFSAYELNLHGTDFSQNPAVWDALCDSPCLANLRVLDVSGDRGSPPLAVCDFLRRLGGRNPALYSLCRINVQNSDIDFNTLNIFKALSYDKPFIRDGAQISDRYSCFIALIYVEAYGTKIVEQDGETIDSWFKIQEPGLKDVIIYYRTGQTPRQGKVKLEIHK